MTRGSFTILAKQPATKEENQMIDECRELTDETLDKFSGLVFPDSEGDWAPLSISCLCEAHRRLISIRRLVDEDLDGSLILMRSLFELAVTVNYIAKDPDVRISTFQQKLPSPGETLDAEFAHKGYFSRSLPNAKDMCSDLGGWAETYYGSAFYRYTSDAAHSGAWTIYRNLGRLRYQVTPDEVDLCRVLVTSADLFLHVAWPALAFYSDDSLLGEWERLTSKWGGLWSQLSERSVEDTS